MRRGWIASPRGASDGDRTRDPLLGRQMLYQLSYTGVFSFTISPVWAVTTLCYTPAWNVSSAGTTPSFHFNSLTLRCQDQTREYHGTFQPCACAYGRIRSYL